jgi:hypothetical protein
MVNSIPSARQCTHAQTAAFLLGVHPELPNVNKEGASSMHVDRHFYGEMGEELFTAQWDNVQLEKSEQSLFHSGLMGCSCNVTPVEFKVPLHTTDTDKWTTYVGQSYSESDCRLNTFDAIKATMDVPKKFQHLGWHTCLLPAAWTHLIGF